MAYWGIKEVTGQYCFKSTVGLRFIVNTILLQI